MTVPDEPFHTGVPLLADLQELNQQQFCTDTGCRLEELLEAMDDREEWRERTRVSEKFVQAAQHNIDIYIVALLEMNKKMR